MRHPSIPAAAWIERFVEKRPNLLKSAQKRTSETRLAPSRAMRERFFQRLHRSTSAMTFASIADVWKEYYCSIPADIDRQSKLATVESLLRRAKPDSVADLGANTGPFSILAAKAGAGGISVDTSEHCMEALYRTARSEGLAITPVIADILCPTPAFGFMSAQFPSLLERARSECTLCLGLMHHLHIRGRQTFKRIAKLLDRLTEHYLIFEFVDMNDANNDRINSGRPISYDLEHVKKALSPHFPTITEFDSDRTTRKLLFCEKPS